MAYSDQQRTTSSSASQRSSQALSVSTTPSYSRVSQDHKLRHSDSGSTETSPTSDANRGEDAVASETEALSTIDGKPGGLQEPSSPAKDCPKGLQPGHWLRSEKTGSLQARPPRASMEQTSDLCLATHQTEAFRGSRVSEEISVKAHCSSQNGQKVH